MLCRGASRQCRGVAPPTSAQLLELDKALQASEALFPAVIPGAEKKIIFANAEQPECTAYAVLYIHGFSACRQEVSPVAEQVAAKLGANYYGMRLTGHGLTAAELGQATPQDWLQDVEDAWATVSQLGKKVVVIATSTGAALATWLAQQPDVAEPLDTLILISPNYRPRHRAISLLLWPWARYWMPLFMGPEYGRPPEDEQAAKYWTAPYPFSLLFGVMALATAVRRSDVSKIKAPTLFIYSDEDETVSAEIANKVRKRWGAPVHQRITVLPDGHSSNHVVTGNLSRPETNNWMISEMQRFITERCVEQETR